MNYIQVTFAVFIIITLCMLCSVIFVFLKGNNKENRKTNHKTKHKEPHVKTYVPHKPTKRDLDEWQELKFYRVFVDSLKAERTKIVVDTCDPIVFKDSIHKKIVRFFFTNNSVSGLVYFNIPPTLFQHDVDKIVQFSMINGLSGEKDIKLIIYLTEATNYRKEIVYNKLSFLDTLLLHNGYKSIGYHVEDWAQYRQAKYRNAVKLLGEDYLTGPKQPNN